MAGSSPRAWWRDSSAWSLGMLSGGRFDEQRLPADGQHQHFGTESVPAHAHTPAIIRR
ncbi:hypothetical protein ACFVH0_06610 [Streptomyces sp. NPDC127117]|uniref:hypothetical protein n=1 Tax=Streptomyces sp. NPDC127117 TaxID=3345368 RepID=UPI003637A61D